MKDTLAPGHSRGPCPPLLWSPHAPQGPGTARPAPAAAGPGGSAGALLPSSGCCPGMEIETPQHGEPPCVSLCAAALTRVSVSAHRRLLLPCVCRLCCEQGQGPAPYLPHLLAITGPSSSHHLQLGTGELQRHVQSRMSSPRRIWVGDSTGQPCGCHWSTAGSTTTLQLDAGFGMYPPEESSVCVCHVLAPDTVPIFQGVHSGVIAKKIAESF